MATLSVVLAIFNEEKHIERCLKEVHTWADEIIVVDGESTDETVKLAKKWRTIVYTQPNDPQDFHKNKQFAVQKATKDWILQLDADEVVTPQLRAEIDQVIQSTKHQGYAIPRRNWFLGRFLTKGGAYPDPVIRLFQNGKGHFPKTVIVKNGITTSNVHAQIEIDGTIGQLKSDLLHYGDVHLAGYLKRLNRYTSLEAKNMSALGKKPSLWLAVIYVVWLPLYWFGMRYFRHRGYMDGFAGFLFALLSALHYPIMYIKLWEFPHVSK